MRRINSVLTVAALMATMLIGSAVPALANYEHYLETPSQVSTTPYPQRVVPL